MKHDLAGEPTVALLEANTICILSTLTLDGFPYAAAAHFAADHQTGAFYVSLDCRSQTAKNIFEDSRTAILVGSDPAVPATLQMTGHATISENFELAQAQTVFYARFPHSLSYRDDARTRFVTFRPTWSRYSDARSHKDFFVRGFALNK